jgi:glucose-1-phosphate thymidylyltransferase
VKAVIPVAGVGTKLRPLTYTQPKPLIPIAGKPILGHIIERLAAAGINEFVFVIGYLGNKIHDFVRDQYPNITSYFVQQSDRKGIGHAIWMAKDIVNEEEMLIVLGDTVFEADIESIIGNAHSVLGIKKVDDPRGFGVVEFDDAGKIKRVVEKPNIPRSNMALVGLYKIRDSRRLFDVLEQNIKKNYTTHNEIQLTDAIGKMIKEGEPFESFKVENWYDCGKKDSLLDANAKLLKKLSLNGASYPNMASTIVVPPVSIAPGVQVSNSIIGPNVTIGDNVTLDYVIVKDSIIGTFSKLKNVVLEKSVIGSDATINGSTQSLNIGDNTEIDFS